ncbi:MAG: type II secretion system F family protein [Phycisphaerae bacterium]|nr:type II secretion system F family protein [Phycisphaerae bacterium]MDD5380359.1 type II secretion system F family protein [Phycisphaerae bacterium]
MKNYKYIARDSSGQRKEGFKDASSSNDLLGWLREQGLTPVSVNEIAVDTPKKHLTDFSKRIKSADLAALCWQLTTMVEGGVAIPTALETISEDVDNLQLRTILKQILEKMLKGETFSNSILEYPKVFNRLAYAMILAGEASGNLSEVLRRLAEYFDSRDKLARKVKGAIAYPIFVLGFIVLIVIFIMAFIIPRFRVIFDQIGGKLPAFTRGFMAVYSILQHNLHYIIGSILFVIVFAVLTSKTQKGHHFFSRIVLSIPLFGKVIKQAFIVTFCRTMSTLVAAGVSVLDVFDILSGMTDNEIIKSAVTRTKERIVGGLNISLSMAAVGFFPNMVIKMIQVGEESGSLASVLERTSTHYERKVDSTITFMTSMLEPIMIVTVGAIVLVVVLAMYLPIFTMSDMAS